MIDRPAQKTLSASASSAEFWARICGIYVLILLLALCFAAPGTAQDGFRVIVHKDNPTTELTRKEVDRIFLKRIKSWDDDQAVAPVNQPADAKIRDLFSDQVHGRSTSSIESFWQRQIFSGRAAPPAVLTNDAAVIAFVGENRGGIGYVSDSVDLPDSVKTIQIVDDK